MCVWYKNIECMYGMEYKNVCMVLNIECVYVKNIESVYGIKYRRCVSSIKYLRCVTYKIWHVSMLEKSCSLPGFTDRALHDNIFFHFRLIFQTSILHRQRSHRNIILI